MSFMQDFTTVDVTGCPQQDHQQWWLWHRGAFFEGHSHSVKSHKLQQQPATA